MCALLLLTAGAAEAANPTTLSINCTPKAVSPGTASSCVVTVTDAGPVASRVAPGGTVTFTVAGSGTFDPGETCALEPSGAFSSKCTVAYTPTAISGGAHRLLGTYNGEDGHGRATSAFTLTVTPANDDFDAAKQLPVPGKETGTTEGATYSDDDPELCSDAYAPVWYSVKPARSGRLAVRLTVHGRTDSVVAVFRQERSKLVPLGCDVSNAAGVAGVPFDATRGTTYVIAVAAPWSAVAGEFVLESILVPPVAFPGTRVSHDGDVVLDPLLRPSAALSVPMKEGTTYRINASAHGACVHVDLLQRASPTADALARSQACTGYLVYTPGRGAHGLFPVFLSMPEGAAARVHVAVRKAEADDLAPGVSLLNGVVRRGHLAARNADVVDTYEFGVPERADATLTLRGRAHVDLLLFDTKGKQLACACEGRRSASIVERLVPGRYLTVLRARPAETGRYDLTLRLREPTTTSIRLTRSGQSRTQLQLAAAVEPAVAGGRLMLELQRFDPLSQWQFAGVSGHAAKSGRTAFGLRATVGSWRVRVQYQGTLSSSPSVSDWITFTVEPATRPAGAHTGNCAPNAQAAFTFAGLTVTCGGFFGEKPPTVTKTPVQGLADLRAAVGAISTLKDPFRSELLDTLDAARAALTGGDPDEARARLEDFISQLQAAPLQAQLTKDQRSELAEQAKRIEQAIP